MFISSDHLGIQYGINDTIARYFVDREPPIDNLYWKGKLLYLRPAPGYLFIPLMVDLLFRIGVQRSELLDNDFILLMEAVGHISALEETRQITATQAIQQCADLAATQCKNPGWLNDVNNFFHKKETYVSALAMPYKALHRGDVFLYALCALKFPPTLYAHIFKLWFALIGTLLLLDDVDDVESDRESGDENAFLDSGLNEQGFNGIKALIARNINELALVNKSMANELNRQYQQQVVEPMTAKLKNL